MFLLMLFSLIQVAFNVNENCDSLSQVTNTNIKVFLRQIIEVLRKICHTRAGAN